jgi:hypothetical protein
MYAMIEYVTDYDHNARRTTDVTLWHNNKDGALLHSILGRFVPENEIAAQFPGYKIMSVSFARIGEAPEPA